ncbi:Krueppel-like factor 9 isoform X2 [Heliangelus exortis]|uniref:Krueppel-like factor 9 isoform X2 n=1 Tax=Heliangelus exortis TaxID=472823 RepID=UPI003A9361EC
MSAVAYVDFVAAQCLVSISNRSAVPEAARLKVPGEAEPARELRDPRDAWKDYCALLAIAKSLLELNKYRPLPAPSVCSDSVESPDEDAGSDSDAATEPGSSPPRSPPPGPPPRLRAAGAAPKGKLAAEKRHKCPYSGCGKVYGKSSHLKAHYRVHTVKAVFLLESIDSETRPLQSLLSPRRLLRRELRHRTAAMHDEGFCVILKHFCLCCGLWSALPVRSCWISACKQNL